MNDPTTKTLRPSVRIVNAQGLMPRGIDDFAKVVTQQRCFVDKSRLARDVLNCDDDIILMTRPRRFGKTTNQSILMMLLKHRRGKPILPLL
ncbi:MAG: AAA family ATPase, partial [Myxococcota bacterium]